MGFSGVVSAADEPNPANLVSASRSGDDAHHVRRITPHGATSCRLQPKINHDIYKILLSDGIYSVIRSIQLTNISPRSDCWKPLHTGSLIVERDDEYLGRRHPERSNGES